jgi:hypothetical protein
MYIRQLDDGLWELKHVAQQYATVKCCGGRCISFVCGLENLSYIKIKKLFWFVFGGLHV